MKEKRCDIRHLIGKVDAVCVTTNGSVKANGDAIMGAGVAKAFKEIYAGMPMALGMSLKDKGNIVTAIFKDRGTFILAFPTKPGDSIVYSESDLIPKFRNTGRVGMKVQGWMMMSTVDIIEKSTIELVKIVNELKLKTIAIPKPGCANDGLNWERTVKPLLSKYLDDRFIICYL